MIRVPSMLLASTTLLATIACSQNEEAKQADDGPSHPLIEAARSQVGVTTHYDSGYAALDYPGGDIPMERGVCTDVIIRAMRKGYRMDLQKLVHVDMKANFSKDPKIWGLKGTDRNIDHRRVPNLQTFFKRKGYALKVSEKAENYQAGDLVTCIVPPHLPHIMLVSNRKDQDGVPFVIHNIGSGAKEEDSLFRFKLTGHYRIPLPATKAGMPKSE